MVGDVFFPRTYPAAAVNVLAWILVLIKSKGWNNIVEQVPLNAPARKAFGTDVYKKRKTTTLIKRDFEMRVAILVFWMLWSNLRCVEVQTKNETFSHKVTFSFMLNLFLCVSNDVF